VTGHRAIPEIEVADAERRLQEATPADGGPWLVDVREVDEFVAARAPGASLFPLSTFLARLHELPRDRELLVICRSGSRSAQATAYLLANGWANVVNVAGGMLAWERSGLETHRGALDPGEGLLLNAPVDPPG
jgi:rhodanese-related sulfurtransferase